MAGGLAGGFKIKNKYFPLGYHHILYQDKPLLATLKNLDILKEVKWKKEKVLFAIDNKFYNLTNPIDFFRFPLLIADKARFIKLMVYCALKRRWEDDLGNAQDWLDHIAGANVRKTIFDPLMDIKYGLPSQQLSANWLGSRLHYQEFSRPLGYIPGTEWTRVLTDALVKKFVGAGGTLITNARAERVIIENNAICGIQFQKDGTSQRLDCEILINTAPPHIFLTLCKYHDKKLETNKYLDALSLIVETNQRLPREFYLLSCLKPRYSFGGIFMLSSLNKTLGVNNGTILNFFTTLPVQNEHLRNSTPEALMELYQNDFEKLFGFRLNPLWHHLSLIKNYSPEFLKDYQNPNPRGTVRGLYFAGNYLTYPVITSTGSAIYSGERAADYIIEDNGS